MMPRIRRCLGAVELLPGRNPRRPPDYGSPSLLILGYAIAMFQIYSVSGAPGRYIPGSVRARRKVDEVGAVSTAPPLPRSADGSSGTVPKDSQHRVIQGYGDAAKEEGTRRRLLYARDIMTSPVFTLQTRTPIQAARDTMTKRRYRHIPIVGDEGGVVGILSDRDVLRWLAAGGVAPDASVTTLMKSEVLVATPETEIRELARVMFFERVGCLPITSDTGALLGIITRSDILRALLGSAPLELWS